MAETYKTLGQVVPAAGTLTTLYTVPGSTSAVVRKVRAVNLSTASGTIRVSVAIGGAADALNQYVEYDMPLPANRSATVGEGLTLAATDVLRVQSSTGQIAFQANGVEIT